MEQSLMEWGVRKGKNDIHATFHKEALEVAGEHSSGTQFTDAKKEECPPKLPMDVLGAVEHHGPTLFASIVKLCTRSNQRLTRTPLKELFGSTPSKVDHFVYRW
jgi:hypothetical protein